MAIDPVCKMEVDESDAEERNFSGKDYYFCSSDCARKFDKDPQEYIEKAA